MSSAKIASIKVQGKMNFWICNYQLKMILEQELLILAWKWQLKIT